MTNEAAKALRLAVKEATVETEDIRQQYEALIWPLIAAATDAGEGSVLHSLVLSINLLHQRIGCLAKLQAAMCSVSAIQA